MRGTSSKVGLVLSTVAIFLGRIGSTPAVADSANLNTFHCLFGCPVGAPANDDLIVREIYTLSSNPVTKLADWVAYRVTPDTIGPSQDRIWTADPWLGGDETLTPYTSAARRRITPRSRS